MEIISRLEINYFRSIYSIQLSGVTDINVLVGGNDVGKSNVLKALNLFFNNDSELGTPFSFQDDFSRVREKEARAAKGRSTIWIKVTFNNYENWSSLPSQFIVKKTWNRYSSVPETSYPGNPNILQNKVSQFINKISFHYIPAVRGRNIFSHYLSLLHDSLVEDERAGVSAASAGLIDEINRSTTDMAARIREELGIDSSIGMPTDLKDLFTALDFSTKVEDFSVPLQRRGDGIQAHHIPFILDFLARHSRKNHIWAYEEPENSLELAKAFSLSDQFYYDFSEDNQIFLTTHSPAFYAMEGEGAARWLVSSGAEEAAANSTTRIKSWEKVEDFDREVGVAALIADRAAELHEQVQELRETNTQLDRDLQETNRPILLVEGTTDKVVLEYVQAVLGKNAKKWAIVSGNGASNVVNYLKSLSVVENFEHPAVIGLLDDDRAGRQALGKLKSKHKDPISEYRIVNRERQILCGLLPTPKWVAEARKKIGKGSVNDESVPVTLERMWPPDFIEQAADEGALTFDPIVANAVASNFETVVNISEKLGASLPSRLRCLVFDVNENAKASFAEWAVNNASDSEIAEFVALFDMLEKILQADQ